MTEVIKVPSGSMKNTFFLLEKLARESFREAKLILKTEDEDDRLSSTVTLGLPDMAYIMLHNPEQQDTCTVLLSTGERIYCCRPKPDELIVSGMEQLTEKVRRAVAAWRSPEEYPAYPFMSFISSEKKKEDLLRILYRYASRMGAQVFISHEKSKGKLIHITSSWLIDTIEKPMDVLIKKDTEWAVYHFENGMALQSSYWFFEAQELLDQIQ